MGRLTALCCGLLLAAGCSDRSATDSALPDLLTPHAVDRPGRPHLPARQASTGSTVGYFGGPVIPNSKVYVVWWGDPSKLKSALTAPHGGIADFYAGITNSSFVDWLNEYNTTGPAQVGSHTGAAGTGQQIGRGNYAGTFTLTAIPPGNVTDGQVQAALDDAFSAGTLPEPDENSLYAIYFPASVSISIEGAPSCGAFYAYHHNTVEAARHNAYYLVMPDCGQTFAGVTVSSSHELAEAMTDGMPTPSTSPEYPQAWNDANGNEVGDLCESARGTVATALGTFSVQGIWDERTQGCKFASSAGQDFSIALPTNVAALDASGSVTVPVQTTTFAGAAQPLNLSVVAPPGVTASLSSTNLTSGESCTLTVSAPPGTPTLGQQVIVRAEGTAAGASPHTAALLLQGPGITGDDFSLALHPGSATVAAGTSVTLALRTAVARGQPATLQLALGGLPAGLSGTFSPSSVVAGGSSVLTLTASPDAPAALASLVVSAVAEGVEHDVALALTVTASEADAPFVNGDFETGSLAGWTGIGTTSVSSVAHAGSSAAMVGAVTPTQGDSVLRQSFTADANAAALSFWYLVHCPDAVDYDWATATLRDDTTATTTTVLAKTCSIAGRWSQVTQAITGGHHYTLSLINHDDGHAGDATSTVFDDVTVTLGAPPAVGITNGDFESAGLAGWTAVGTVSVAASGHGGAAAAQLGATAATLGDSSLTQNFIVPAGMGTLSIWYRNVCGDGVATDWATISLQDTTSGSSITVLPKTCSPTATWTQVQTPVFANHSYSLTMTNHDDGYAKDPTTTLFDDVTLE